MYLSLKTKIYSFKILSVIWVNGNGTSSSELFTTYYISRDMNDVELRLIEIDQKYLEE